MLAWFLVGHLCLGSFRTVTVMYAVFLFFEIIRRPPISTRTDTPFPSPPLFRSPALYGFRSPCVSKARARHSRANPRVRATWPTCSHRGKSCHQIGRAHV